MKYNKTMTFTVFFCLIIFLIGCKSDKEKFIEKLEMHKKNWEINGALRLLKENSYNITDQKKIVNYICAYFNNIEYNVSAGWISVTCLGRNKEPQQLHFFAETGKVLYSIDCEFIAVPQFPGTLHNPENFLSTSHYKLGYPNKAIENLYTQIKAGEKVYVGFNFNKKGSILEFLPEFKTKSHFTRTFDDLE